MSKRRNKEPELIRAQTAGAACLAQRRLPGRLGEVLGEWEEDVVSH